MLCIQRRGPHKLRKVAVASGTVISIGDLIWFDAATDKAKPASDFDWDTDGLAETQAAFAAVFLGVAHESSADGETDPISYDCSPASVYEIDVVSGTYHANDTFGPDENSSTLMNQKLESAVATSSIARCAKEMSAAGTRVWVTFAPALVTNSSNVNANLG